MKKNLVILGISQITHPHFNLILCEVLQLKEYPVWRWVADDGLSVLSCEKSKRLTPLFGGRHPPSLCLPVSGWNDEWPGETQSGDIIELLGC